MNRNALVGLLVVLGCVAVWAIVHISRPSPGTRTQVAQTPIEPVPALPIASDPIAPAAHPDAAPEQAPPAAAKPLPVLTADPAPMPVEKAAPPPAQRRRTVQATAAAEPDIPKPLARAALGFVGADPEAEALWASAINDPNRSSEERKDLIEDLNEDGFPDPKNLTEEDLPLILSRLALIEELAPEAMDEVNAAAFAEAYKDLVNMFARVSQN